jgi:hypothetical protein
MGTFAETTIDDTVYRLPTKENKLPFSVSICNKQTKVCRFRFSFAANKQKLPFSVCTRVSDETWRHENMGT